MNEFECEGRARKVQRLCRAIDRDVEVPRESLVSLAGFLRAQTAEWWAELAKRAGCNKPSATTIEAVALEYEARHEEAQHTHDREFEPW